LLQYHVLGVSDARQIYALPATEQISRVIFLSQELKRFATLKRQTGMLGSDSAGRD